MIFVRTLKARSLFLMTTIELNLEGVNSLYWLRLKSSGNLFTPSRVVDHEHHLSVLKNFSTHLASDIRRICLCFCNNPRCYPSWNEVFARQTLGPAFPAIKAPDINCRKTRIEFLSPL
jgi:hypothetical protein